MHTAFTYWMCEGWRDVYKVLVFISDFIEIGCVALHVETSVFQESSSRACTRTVALYVQCLSSCLLSILPLSATCM